jgi:hypothetical protein
MDIGRLLDRSAAEAYLSKCRDEYSRLSGAASAAIRRLD